MSTEPIDDREDPASLDQHRVVVGPDATFRIEVVGRLVFSEDTKILRIGFMSGEVQIGLDEVDEWYEDETVIAPAPQAAAIDPATKYARSQLRVVRETKDYQLDYSQHALRPGRELIDIAPSCQRRLRWPNKKKSLLIESFLLNIPVPPIFLFERDYNEYEVIDGRQRLESIRGFLNNEFALAGLEYWPELNRDEVCRPSANSAKRAAKEEPVGSGALGGNA